VRHVQFDRYKREVEDKVLETLCLLETLLSACSIVDVLKSVQVKSIDEVPKESDRKDRVFLSVNGTELFNCGLRTWWTATNS